tara:strand:- start:27 stop:185 length:159 start_codon:yes stop_codon:yes gene_type:complete
MASKLERFQNFMDWMGKGLDFFVAALAYILIVGLLGLSVVVVIHYLLLILGA